MQAIKVWINTLSRAHIFHPRNPTLFLFRIWLRVRRLLIQLWWREDVSAKAMLAVLPRPALVLLVGLGAPALMLYLAGNLDLLNNVLARANTTTTTKMPWREFVQLTLLCVGLPAAFILWTFRDHHVQATLENQRKDVNLKAFQEIQLRAAGALDEKLPSNARERLQIAAVNQLRAFLRGEFGEEFRRPAFELVLAMQQSVGERLGISDIRQQIRPSAEEGAKDLGEKLRPAIETLYSRRTNVEQALAQVIRSEWRAIWRSGFPMAGRSMDLIGVEVKALLCGAKLKDVHLCGADLSWTHLEGADLSWAHLEGAVLREAHLEGAVLTGSHFEGADLNSAHLEGADLSWAHLEGADLREAHLEGTKLQKAHLEGVDLSCAHLEYAVLREAYLEGTKLRKAHLEGADLSCAHLEGARLQKAHFEGAILCEAHLEGAVLTGAHLEGAVLTGAHLEGATLRGSHLNGANVTGAYLQGADLHRAHLKGADLSWAHLEGADLRRAVLEGANLSWAHLEGASLDEAWFDDNTILISPSENPDAAAIKAAQDRLRALGARHVVDKADRAREI